MDYTLIDWLKHLVNIPSGSFNRRGVAEVQREVERVFKQIGLEVRKHYSPETAYQDQYILEGYWAPKEKTSKGAFKWVTLVTHADTVFEEDFGFLEFKWDRRSDRAFGPGVIDDKGGIVVATEGVRKFVQLATSVKADFGVRILVTPSEEIGSPGFQNVLKGFGKDSFLALGFEPALEKGEIIGSRRGNRWFQLSVEGRAAHTGRAAHLGVNAAHALAHQLVELDKWKRKHKEITLETGKIEGGQKVNIVCPHASAWIDTRFKDFKGQQKVEKKFQEMVKLTTSGVPRTTLKILDDCPPFVESKESKKIQKRYLQSLKKCEGKSRSVGRGGGAADVNFMSHPRLMVLDGLGPIGGGLHETTEFVFVKSLETRSLALTDFLEGLCLQKR